MVAFVAFFATGEPHRIKRSKCRQAAPQAVLAVDCTADLLTRRRPALDRPSVKRTRP